MNSYKISVAGVTRELPIIQVSSELSIASFVILGDCELVTAAAIELEKKIPEVDYILTAEAKGIPIANEICRLRNMPYYIVARKSIKPYMDSPIVEEVISITSQKKQILGLDGKDADIIRGKKIVILDDVISTGESLLAIERLAEKAGANIVCRAAILAEGDAKNREDIVFLEALPLFPNNK
ncbi:adenine phosphoribosyltransferase [Sedimentibacter sp. zth1]|uniref:phosphoribosyltransferase family protein n=1 Tax=Sedimentibacter sp. zth1 TaxID=2816908 RepID=UPI001A9245D6|nr:phosphoribosyltransferase family protein [Sedimentibacter sp. zth1]QSX06084.1 adenine phosphoribosyltransferase [Sedimentibacter sp. zth1]